MRAVSIASFVALGMSLAASAQADVFVDFDGSVSTDITHQYPGATFTAPFGGTGPVRTYAVSFADSGGNVVGLSGSPNFYAFNQSDGAVDIVLDVPVAFVSVKAKFVVATDAFLEIGGKPFMAAYNSTTLNASTRLGIVEWNLPGDPCLSGNFCFSNWDTLAFSSTAADIKTIRLTGSLAPSGGVSRRAIFDSFVATSVPEPASYGLMLAGLGVLGAAARRRR